jgi:hypothetical protein
VRDLLGVHFDATDPNGLTEDPEWNGFERLGSILSLSPSHIEKYITAAQTVLAEASIDRAFQRHVDCDRGVLRVCEDLHDLDSYNRVLVISIGKAAHAMVNSLEMQAGNRFQGPGVSALVSQLPPDRQALSMQSPGGLGVTLTRASAWLAGAEPVRNAFKSSTLVG